MPVSLFAQFTIPDVYQCLKVAGPILGVFFLRWLFLSSGEIIHRLFPHWKWEQELGWLNIRAQKRADRFLRWVGYLVYASLAGALYGIVWSVPRVIQFAQEKDPNAAADDMAALSVLLISSGLWAVYLGFELIPKLRSRFEEEELQRFRAEHADDEEEIEQELRRRQMKLPGQSRFGGTNPSLRRKR